MALGARCSQGVLSQLRIQNAKGDKQTNGTVCWVKRKGHGKERRRQAGRRRRGARPGCLLIGRAGRVRNSGPAAGSDPQPKQTYLRGLGGRSSPTQMESKANRNPAGPSCDPCPQTQQGPLTPPPITPNTLSRPKEPLATTSPSICCLNASQEMPGSPAQRIPRPCPPPQWLCIKYQGHLCLKTKQNKKT